ncbi:hypothetical protein Clole_3129 [Cellulosilyticum lentocellum DSM 5427]|uniref:Uncharacterized protein n=1 Tax=Cellulosilyticum lentocellum (strain ATCC 49066 / DSM 5427 / NCIMB 11756 / RHM5) TaxID=642492 RepID=F2JP85_CELLD|nr:hypothetical protein Clole_3129 [Cellulosilyticum lentocellum DSM 5427]
MQPSFRYGKILRINKLLYKKDAFYFKVRYPYKERGDKNDFTQKFV